MNRHAVYHKINSNFAYAEAKGVVRILLRAAKDDLLSANIMYYNRFHDNDIKTAPMQKFLTDSLFDYYQARLFLSGGSCVYYFKLCDTQTENLYFSEMGFSDTAPGRIGSFEMLAMHESEINTCPKWAQESVFYQIFPDRFAKGGNYMKNPVPWNSEPTFFSVFGGDFDGIVANLDYITDLGANALYLTPVFLSGSCHRYDTVDYYQIDPILGGTDAAKRLMEACKKRGIRVVFDAVFNHCSDRFFAFEDVKKHGARSRYRDWFYIDDFKQIADGKAHYATFADEANMPKLNTENPETADYLISVAEHWTRTLGVDGWRLDVADEVCSSFWRSFRQRLRRIDPELFILGEVWHNGEYWLQNKFDSVMNYQLRENIVSHLNNQSDFVDRMTRQLLLYPFKNALANFNLIGSHDTQRALTALGDNVQRLKLAAVIQFCFCGIPCLYYGDELGMRGGNDPFCRRCMNFEGDEAIKAFYKKLIAVKKSLPALHYGDFAWVNGGGIGFTRKANGQCVTVTVNPSTDSVQLSTDDPVLFGEGHVGKTLLPLGFAIQTSVA